MAQPVIQKSFNAGEWAPALNARVDLQKYHSGAALLENFFVDYRGGASTRPGTKYILQAYKSATAVRLIPFQASFTVGYVLEFGHQYIRFYNNGAPVLETGLTITGATKANPCVVSVANTYTTGDVDWIYISGVSGMTELNGRYFKVHTRTAGTVTLYDLFGNPVDSTGYGTWTAGGTTKRVYTISSPYSSTDLATLKFAQNISAMILCHPSYAPYVLTLVAATNWTLLPITFGSTVGTPAGVSVATTLAGGSVHYSYCVTAVDSNGQESIAGTAGTLASKTDLRTVGGTNTVSWTAVSGAVSYNVYKAELSYAGAVPTGSQYGFIGNCTGLNFVDSNIAPDFSLTLPVPKSPFATGAAVQSTTVLTVGNYTTTPTVTFDAAPAGGVTATGTAVMEDLTDSLTSGGTGFAVNDTVSFPGGFTIRVDGVSGAFAITTYTVLTHATIIGAVPANPVSQTATSGAGTGATLTFTWKTTSIFLTNSGAGYLVTPNITYSAGAATATATLGAQTISNPSVPAFFQQRLILAAPTSAVQTFYASQPGAYYNFNVTSVSQNDDSINATLVSGQLNTIKSMVPQTAGLLILTDKASWLVNGGSPGSGISPSTIVANAQSFNGVSDVPPIVANFDVLYVQAKGSIVRDSSYNFYSNVFTGTDISVLSSHLFYGYTITEWAWAEEPFKVVWAVRDDGTMLTLTFLKEQEFIGWAHSTTTGLFKSVATITEAVGGDNVDAVYTVVQRTVNAQPLQYIERFSERLFTNGVTDAWCVDSGLQYNSTPATSFTGGEHLAGLSCTGLADGVIIPAFTMAASGAFTLATAASKVTVGLAFTPKLQTLALDTGEPTIQGKVKKVAGVVVRVADTLGLKIGGDFTHLVDMKDLVRGNVSGMLTGQSSQVVSDLVTGDAYTVINPSWTVPGQYCFQQSYPYPATILGVIPEIVVGDTAK